MSKITSKTRLILCSLAIVSVCIFFNLSARSQDPPQEENSRRLWDSEFLKKRAAAKTTSPARKSTGYRRLPPQNPPSSGKPADSKVVDEKAEGEMVGVTVWKLRPSKQSDNQEARLLVEEEESGKKEWTLVRVESETVFAPGDRVKLSIESPRDGYLYVIDREQYADGTFSDPYLIFPTLKNRNGDNSVRAGKVIELPERSTFLLKPMRDDYTGEVLTVLVTQQPLAEVKAGPRMIKLEKEQLERWEKQWGVSAEQFELIGGAGKAYTKAEKEAGQEGARLLTQEDELPQTLYRINTGRGNPLLINVPLKIK